MYNQEKKADAGKDRWELLPINQIRKVVKVLTDGAEKYGDDGWRSVDKPQPRFYAAMMRHLYEWRRGRKIDSESGMNHMIHVICNAIFLAELDEAEFNFSQIIEACNDIREASRKDKIAIRAVDEDDKKEYHGRDCMKCKKHHVYFKAVIPDGGTYQKCTGESAHWCDALGKEIPDNEVRLVNYCPEFEEIEL